VGVVYSTRFDWQGCGCGSDVRLSDEIILDAIKSLRYHHQRREDFIRSAHSRIRDLDAFILAVAHPCRGEWMQGRMPCIQHEGGVVAKVHNTIL